MPTQRRVDLLPRTIVSLFDEIVVHRLPAQKVVGQLPPLAAGTHNIQQRIDYPLPLDSRWTATIRVTFGQDERRNQRPLVFRYVTRIVFIFGIESQFRYQNKRSEAFHDTMFVYPMPVPKQALIPTRVLAYNIVGW